MKTLFKTIVLLLLSLLFVHCKPEPKNPYIDLSPDITMGFGDSVFLDVNSDGINDICVTVLDSQYKVPSFVPILSNGYVDCGCIDGLVSSKKFYPTLYNHLIGDNVDWDKSTVLLRYLVDHDVYVACKFAEKEGNYFAWIKINYYRELEKPLTIDSYYFNNNPNESIRAGIISN